MKRDAHLSAVGHRLSTLAITAMLACFLAFGVSDALASATATSSPTRAQKLTKALKACKKLPKKKRAACVRHAKKKYGPLHTPAPLPATGATPTGLVAPTGSGTTPTAGVTSPAGPVAPSGPTFAEIQRIECFFYYNCDAAHPMLNLTVLERGVPRLGTGVSQQRGGDNVPSDTWIFPLLLSYDAPVQTGHFEPCPPTEPFCVEKWVTETEHYYSRVKTNAQLANTGVWTLSFQASSTTCEPVLPTYCNTSVGGGA
jgi:hypothetical protein